MQSMLVWVRRVSLALLLVFSGHTLVCEPATTPADVVFRHGAVYTVDGARSWAEAVAVSRDRIVYVGFDHGIRPWIGDSTVVVDLGGRMMLPGFHDSHAHPLEGGVALGECALHEATTVHQILELVTAFARENPDARWIRGGGWQLPVFPQANPNRALLDRIVPDRPVYLTSADAHSAWVNSRALEVAGITRDTPDPLPGRIERDPVTGEASGTLRENAMTLVQEHLPEYSEEMRQRGLRRTLEVANRFGITSIQEARAEQSHLSAYKALDERGKLTARIVASLPVDSAKGIHQVPELARLRDRYRGRHLRAHSVKIFADGVIEAKTAALLEPYLGSEGRRGEVNLQPEAFRELAEALDREGFQIHVHAIGDRAIRNSLDALAFARERNGARDSRHTLAHLELFDPKDISRLRALGVVANFQPFWAYEDEYIRDLTVPVLGPERSRWLYPIRSLADSGAVLVCGSDWNVSSLNPLDGMQVGITRRGLDQGPGAAWIPAETVNLRFMLEAYTMNGAYLAFAERDTGSIEVGKLADLVVLDRNLFDVPPQDIHRCRVLLTLFEGRVVYRSPDFDYRGP